MPKNSKDFPKKKMFPRNLERASWAAETLEYFGETVCLTDEEDRLQDLLGNLLHYADANNVDFDKTLNRARGTYEEECGDGE